MSKEFMGGVLFVIGISILVGASYGLTSALVAGFIGAALVCWLSD